MATPRFPLTLLRPTEWRWSIANAALSGGAPVSGPGQSADASAGGHWVYEHQTTIWTRDQIGALRAIVGQANSGVALYEVPVLDALQPWPGGVHPARTPFSDQTPFSDTSQMVTRPIVAALAAAVYMPAFPAPAAPPTVAQIAITQGETLKGGEYFSLIGPSGAVRLHMVTSITDVTDGVSTVSVVPPFREDMPSGTSVDFNDPRCTMKLDVGSARDAWQSYTPTMRASPKLIWIESGFAVPSEG